MSEELSGPPSTARGALAGWRRAVASSPEPTKGTLVLVALQHRFWMEWVLFAAHRLYAEGCRPIVLFSQREVDHAYRAERDAGGADADLWAEARTCEYLTFVDVDEEVAGAGAYQDVATRRVRQVVAYALGVEEGEGEALGETYTNARALAMRILCDRGPRVEAALVRLRPDRVVCPSGLLGWSVVVAEAARRLAIPAIFVETFTQRPGHMVWNRDRPAVDIDLDGWLEVAGPWDAQKAADAAAFATFQEGRAEPGNPWVHNARMFQRDRNTGELPARIEAFLASRPQPILAGPNIVADSVTLGRATIFRSQRQWIGELIAFFRRRENLKLILRAHPAELSDQPRCRIADLARELAGGAPNILIIDGRESVSTYALIERCVLGLIWVSNVGVDMVIRGRPVLAAAAPQYAAAGICYTARSTAEYFSTLDRLAANPPGVDAGTIRRAQLYQWVMFRRMSLEATARSYQTADYRLTAEWMHPDQEVFYRILMGELSDKGLPHPPERTHRPLSAGRG